MGDTKTAELDTKKFDFNIFVPRFDIENCKSCECDSLGISSYYSGLRYGGSCGRFSEGYLEYQRRLGDPKDDSSSSTTTYIRFVSDEIGHYKGFNLTFIAQSYTGKGGYELSWRELINN